MGCADPPAKGVGAPDQCSRVNEKRSGWGGSYDVTGLSAFKVGNLLLELNVERVRACEGAVASAKTVEVDCLLRRLFQPWLFCEPVFL